MNSLAQLDIFKYVAAPRAEIYRAIMVVFKQARERFALALRPAEVGAALDAGGLVPALEPEDLTSFLKGLCSWGNLESHPDTAEVTTVEDFYRARFLYQMTPAGEAAEEAVRFFEEHLEQPGELQSAALQDIMDLLGELATLAEQDPPDDAKVHRTLKELSNRFGELTSKAGKFIAGLQRSIDLRELERDAFLAYKEKLIDYLDSFVRDLLTSTFEIVSLMKNIEILGIEPLIEAAARRDLENAFNPTQKDRTDKYWEWRNIWYGSKNWFTGDEHQTSQAEILRSRARAAIPALINAVAGMNDRRLSRSDRSMDLRTLARWFAQTESSHQAHRLWRSAFALGPARHLRIDEETLATRDANPIPSHASWLHAEPVHISLRLRKTGQYVRKRGPRPKVVDHSGDKQKLKNMLQAETLQIEKARTDLANGRRMRLSDLEELDATRFQLFLDLLGEALSRKTPGSGKIEACSTDGALNIILEPIEDSAPACIRTSTGVLTGKDHYITILDVFANNQWTGAAHE